MKELQPFAIKNTLLVGGLHLGLGHAERHPVLIVPVIRVHLFDKAWSPLAWGARGLVAHLSLLFSTFGHVAQACKWNKSPRRKIATTVEGRQ